MFGFPRMQQNPIVNMGAAMGLENNSRMPFNYGTAPAAMQNALKNDPRLQFSQQQLNQTYDYSHNPMLALGANLLGSYMGNSYRNKALEDFGQQQSDYQSLLKDALAKRATGQRSEATQALLSSPYGQEMGMEFLKGDEALAAKQADFEKEAALRRELQGMQNSAQFGLEKLRQGGRMDLQTAKRGPMTSSAAQTAAQIANRIAQLEAKAAQ